MLIRHPILRRPADADDGSGGGGAAPAAAPAAASAPAAPAPATAPAASAAAPAASPAPAASAPAAGPAPAPASKEEGYWPQDWRQNIAKTDEKALARLQRYASPEAAVAALFAAQAKISSGELRPVLGKNATTEEVAEYRKALGIPESADKYDLGDLAFKENEAAFGKLLLEQAHATNQTPEQVKASVKVFREMQTKAEEARFERDEAQKSTGEDELRGEWGPEFRRNITMIHNLLNASGPQDVKDLVLSGRLADGTMIANHPGVLRMLLGVALAANPAGVVVPAGGDPMKGIADEKATIEKRMREDRAGYDKDEKMQSRYRELIDAEMQMKKRAA
ncbi:MAG TPA: hypothetical protein VIO33_07025 [Burkholderiaceae bacterium]